MLKRPFWTPSGHRTGPSSALAGLCISTDASEQRLSIRRSLVVSCAPKNAGKKSKEGLPAHSQASSEGAPVPPPRIIETGQLSLKRQKRFVEARKRAEQAAATSSKPIVTRKFRRKALDPDERYAQERAKMEASRVQRAAQEELRQRRRAARDMLRAREADEGKLPVLLVDGYNVLNARWKLLGTAEACPMSLEDEREQLINDTRDYALSLSCRSIVVFDAMASRHTLGTPRETTAGVEVVYTKESDADMFIMAEARAQREAGAPRVVVVSGDTEISASLAYGRAMGWMTSEMYMLEMKRVTHLVNKAQKAAEERQYDELLEGGGNIALSTLKDEATLEKVAEMRRQLGNAQSKPGKSLFRMERWL